MGRLFLAGLILASVLVCALTALILVRSERVFKDRLTQDERVEDEGFYLQKFVFNYTDKQNVYHRIFLQRREDGASVLCKRTDGDRIREADQCGEEVLDRLLEVVERNGLSTWKESAQEDSRIRYSYGNGEKHDIGIKCNRISGRKIISQVEAVLDRMEYDE